MSGMDRLMELLSRASECFKHHGVAGGLAADIDEALADHRRASQAAPAPNRCEKCNGRSFAKVEGSDAYRCVECKDVVAAPAPSDGLREAVEALTVIKTGPWDSGYISLKSVLQLLDRAALTASPAQEGGE